MTTYFSCQAGLPGLRLLPFRFPAWVAGGLLFFHFILGASHALAHGDDPIHSIQQVIASTYDRPDAKVMTRPVVVVEDFALADWLQGDKGGRALLKRSAHKWDIVACGGDGFKDAQLLKDAGVPLFVGQQLIERLNHAEKSLDPHVVQRFGLFDRPHHQPPASAPHDAHTHHAH